MFSIKQNNNKVPFRHQVLDKDTINAEIILHLSAAKRGYKTKSYRFTVNKFYVENSDLLGGRYGLATIKVLPVDHILVQLPVFLRCNSHFLLESL
jgi:hypothetical protein